MSLAQTPYVSSSYLPPQSGPGILLGAGVGRHAIHILAAETASHGALVARSDRRRSKSASAHSITTQPQCERSSGMSNARAHRPRAGGQGQDRDLLAHHVWGAGALAECGTQAPGRAEMRALASTFFITKRR